MGPMQMECIGDSAVWSCKQKKKSGVADVEEENEPVSTKNTW